MRLKDTTQLVLRVPAENVSRHRGWVVHYSVGGDSWSLSAACGARLATFKLRVEAELAMRRVSEVLDASTCPLDDIHRVQVWWDRVDDPTRQRILNVLRNCGAETP